MDDADKAGLQFVFPAYLLILTMTVIVLCHYFFQRSPTSSASSCWPWYSIIIGERAVGVISTLIYLSCSKLLRTVIDVVTYSTVYLPTADMYDAYCFVCGCHGDMCPVTSSHTPLPSLSFQSLNGTVNTTDCSTTCISTRRPIR